MAPGKEANTQWAWNSNFDIHVYSLELASATRNTVEKRAKVGVEMSLFCNHFCSTWPNSSSRGDLLEKYCNSEKALHDMFNQHCFPLVKQNTSSAQVAVDVRGQPYLSIRTKCTGGSYPLLCPGFHVNKCPAKWSERNWRYKLHPGPRSLWKGQNECVVPALQIDANFQFI